MSRFITARAVPSPAWVVPEMPHTAKTSAPPSGDQPSGSSRWPDSHALFRRHPANVHAVSDLPPGQPFSISPTDEHPHEWRDRVEATVQPLAEGHDQDSDRSQF